jgi:large subunit ribosomal protein L22
MEAVAKLKNVPLSARKMRYVVDSIRGKSVDDALNILKYSKREASEFVEKLLLSAIANWENKLDMAYNADDYNLIIKSVFVDEAGMLKRFRPAPHGRAHRIRKRSNHVTMFVENKTALENEGVEEIIEEKTQD